MSKITYSLMSDQLMKLCHYYFFDTDFLKRIKTITQKYTDKEAGELSKKLENDTDKFIHKMASYIDGNRNESIQFIKEAPDDIIAMMYFRLSLFMVYSADNPDKKYPLLLDDDKQLVLDCLINFWHEYKQDDPLTLLV